MQIPISQAKSRLTELVREAEAGHEVILTRHGQAAVRLVPVQNAVDLEARANAIRSIMNAASTAATPGADAAHSQDFLYDEDGLPA